VAATTPSGAGAVLVCPQPHTRLVQPVLGDLRADLGQIEDLPGPIASALRIGHVVPAVTADGGVVIDYLVRVGDLLQPPARIPSAAHEWS
jgi:hypothetical protein